MEDEGRALPEGWIRQYDPKEDHQFFVDTKANPPRAIWHHPYDDDQFLRTLSSEERERVQELNRVPTRHDIGADSDEEEHETSAAAGKRTTTPARPSVSAGGPSAELPPRPQKQGFGSKLKDKVTGSTHEEREERRKQRAEEEKRQYEAHLAYRRAMNRAMETGQPQLLGKDKDGHDIFIEPPTGLNQGYGGGYGQGYSGGGYGINPYRQGPYANPYQTGAYANPNARFIRPQNPYNRPYGYGYGGGYGLPLAGGLLGGALLGGLLF